MECHECKGQCCTVLAVEIETPLTKDDFEDIKWYLYHKDVVVYIGTDDSWNVQFSTRCSHLGKDGRCLIYSKRPPVCKNYHVKDCPVNKQEARFIFNNVEKYEKWLNDKNNNI